MDISIVLLLCFIILCVTRAAEGPFRRLGFAHDGKALLKAAACGLLLLIANAYPITPLPELSINPASILLCMLVGLLCGRETRAAGVLQAMLFAVFAGVLMAALRRALLSGRLTLPEPGFFLGLCALPFALLLRREPAAALFSAALAPLILTLAEGFLELHTFGYAVVAFGSPAAFDAQVCGVLLAGLLLTAAAPRPAEAPA